MSGAAAITLRDQDGREHRIGAAGGGAIAVGDAVLTVHPAPDGSLHVRGAETCVAWAVRLGETTWVFVDGRVFTFTAARPSQQKRRSGAHHGSLTAPMPATVRKVAVAPGDTVRRGDVLLVLEAMKMELPVRATSDGRVAAINCSEGDLVQPGTSLIELDEEAG